MNMSMIEDGIAVLMKPILGPNGYNSASYHGEKVQVHNRGNSESVEIMIDMT